MPFISRTSPSSFVRRAWSPINSDLPRMAGPACRSIGTLTACLDSWISGLTKESAVWRSAEVRSKMTLIRLSVLCGLHVNFGERKVVYIYQLPPYSLRSRRPWVPSRSLSIGSGLDGIFSQRHLLRGSRQSCHGSLHIYPHRRMSAHHTLDRAVLQRTYIYEGFSTFL